MEQFDKIEARAEKIIDEAEAKAEVLRADAEAKIARVYAKASKKINRESFLGLPLWAVIGAGVVAAAALVVGSKVAGL